MPRNFLIVEGPSEFELLTRVIKRHYPDQPPIQIISVEGDTHQAKRSISAISKAYSPMGAGTYGEKIIILCDKPTAQAQVGYDSFIAANAASRRAIKSLCSPSGSLEECCPAEWRRSEEETKFKDAHKKKQLFKLFGDKKSAKLHLMLMCPLFMRC